MEYRILCDGLPIGTASIVPLAGLAYGRLDPAPGYEYVRPHAIAAGRRLNRVGIWDPLRGDFAEEFARAWEGGRLALTDLLGDELAVASVVIIDWERSGGLPRPLVIVDARPDMARVEAFLRTLGPSDDDKSRPAA
jgi:hypothetical protein